MSQKPQPAIQSDDPMGTNIIHTLLVTSNRLQRVPSLLVLGWIVLLSLLVYWIWNIRHDSAAIVAVMVLATSLIDWLSLWLLPRLERSFGPDRPSALALATVRALMVIIAGVIGFTWWVTAAFCVVLTVVALYAVWIEPFRLGVTHQCYTYRGWKAGANPLRLLHIGDLHLERITSRERKLNQVIHDLKPDIVVFSGDFVNISYTYDPTSAEQIRQIIRAWDAPLGVYCVPGTYTVEPIERVREFVAGLDNLRLLEDEWLCLDTHAGPLSLLGMVTTHRRAADALQVEALAKQMQDCDGPRLLLTHAPDVAPEADKAGYDLYLCGHTHGGQLRFPLIGAVFTGSALGKRFVMGRYDLSRVTVYTTRGIGLEGLGAPRARFLCPPELVLWEISGQS